MNTLWQDLRFGIRMALKNPGFAAAAVVTLALGIGANTAIFSVVNAVLLRSLPFREPERLVVLWESVRKEGARQPLSYPDFEDWRRQNRVFEQIAAGSGAESLTMTGRGTAQQVGAEYVTENFFAVLGIAPLLGRVFLPEENSPGGHHRVAVLSYEIWQRRFGADPGVINQVLVLNEISYTVIGVMPPGFRGESDRADLWLPFRSVALGFPVGDFVTDRQVRWHVGVGRLKPGVTLTQAQADLEGIARQLEAAYPDTNTGVGVWLQPMTEAWVGEFRAALLALLSAVGFVLLIACSNVANLQLGRARARRKELAVCAALGASRARLIRQLLTDSLLLAILGGLAGGLLAAWLTSALLAFSPIAFPSFVRVTLDWRVLSFASALSVLSGVLSGFLPAWTTTRADLASLLNEGRQTATREHRRLGASLVVAELALAVVLLVGAGLMIRSLLGLQQTDLGFDGRNLLTLRLHTGAQKYERPEAVVSLSEELLTRLAVLPGVASVALVQADLPPGGGYYGWPAELQGRPLTSPDAAIRLNQHRVSPGFFATFDVPLISGRVFTPQDQRTTPHVAIISASLAHRYWGNEDPVGKQLRQVSDNEPGPWHTIVGVVSDVKYRGRLSGEGLQPDIYLPLLQNPMLDPRHLYLVVRGAGEVTSLVGAVRKTISNLHPDLPLDQTETMERRLNAELGQQRFLAVLASGFSLLALVLAAVGVYGVMSYAVTQRRQEIGIRVALGAQARDVLNLIIGQGIKLALVGVAIGLSGALALTRLLKTLLFGVSATDPPTFAGIALLLTAVVLLACYIPARRATKVDPMVALRYE